MNTFHKNTMLRFSQNLRTNWEQAQSQKNGKSLRTIQPQNNFAGSYKKSEFQLILQLKVRSQRPDKWHEKPLNLIRLQMHGAYKLIINYIGEFDKRHIIPDLVFFFVFFVQHFSTNLLYEKVKKTTIYSATTTVKRPSS